MGWNKPYFWPCKWVFGVIGLLIGVRTPFITGRGPPCTKWIVFWAVVPAVMLMLVYERSLFMAIEIDIWDYNTRNPIVKTRTRFVSRVSSDYEGILSTGFSWSHSKPIIGLCHWQFLCQNPGLKAPIVRKRRLGLLLRWSDSVVDIEDTLRKTSPHLKTVWAAVLLPGTGMEQDCQEGCQLASEVGCLSHRRWLEFRLIHDICLYIWYTPLYKYLQLGEPSM